jgi:hypothetical protein
MTAFGYGRVSTIGQSLDCQLAALKAPDAWRVQRNRGGNDAAPGPSHAPYHCNGGPGDVEAFEQHSSTTLKHDDVKAS